MVISVLELVTLLHGMGFGVLFMLAFSGAIGIIYAAGAVRSGTWTAASVQNRLFRFYLLSMTCLCWLAVLSGTYIVYPWYRAVPPDGTRDFAHYPRRLLLASPDTAGWHQLGMEWKEHISWLAPIAMTMVAFVFLKYGPQLVRHRQITTAVTVFVSAAFLATAVSGGFGALISTRAPVTGGPSVVLAGPE